MPIKFTRVRSVGVLLGASFLVAAIAAGTGSAPIASTSLAPRIASPLLAAHLRPIPYWLQKTQSTGGQQGNNKCGDKKNLNDELKEELDPGHKGRTIRMQDGARTVTFPVAVLSLHLSADKLQLVRGESTRYHVLVSGLEGLPDSVWQSSDPSQNAIREVSQAAPGFHIPHPGEKGSLVLLLHNLSPQVITMDKARNGVVAITINQSAIHDGQFQMDGTLQSKMAGGFSVSGKLLSLLAPAIGTRMPTFLAIGAPGPIAGIEPHVEVRKENGTLVYVYTYPDGTKVYVWEKATQLGNTVFVTYNSREEDALGRRTRYTQYAYKNNEKTHKTEYRYKYDGNGRTPSETVQEETEYNDDGTATRTTTNGGVPVIEELDRNGVPMKK